MKEKKIFWSPKIGANKAFLAEAAIKLVKNRLYRCLRQLGIRSWPQFLPLVTRDINNSPLITLGYEKPSSVLSGLDEPRIREAQEKLREEMSPTMQMRYFPPDVDWEQQEENRKNYDNQETHKFELGTYVYADLTDEPMTKGFDYKRGRIYRISQIQSEKDPVRYGLHGLKKEIIPGTYTAASLKLCPEDPETKEFWHISQIKKYRTVNGVKQALVSYQFYPASYDTWVDVVKDIVPAAVLNKNV